MSEPQSTNACLELLSSLSWLPALLSGLASLATVYAVCIAHKALHSWREQSHSNRKAEAAISLLAAANDIAVRLRAVRIGIGLTDDDSEDPSFEGRKRELEAISLKELFRMSSLLKALDESIDIQTSVNALSRARWELSSLLDQIQIAIDSSDRERLFELHGKYATVQESDPINRKIQEAIDGLEEKLFPLIRLEQG